MSKRAIARQEKTAREWEQTLALRRQQAAETRKSELEKAEKFMQLDDASMREAFTVYRQAVQGIGRSETADQVRGFVDQIIEIWGSWNTARLTAEQQGILYTQYALNLPKLIKQAAEDERKSYTSERRARYSLQASHAAILAVIVDQANPVKPLPLTPMDTVTTMFPVLAHINPELETSLTQLQRLWDQAQQQAATVEDRFFLDQMTTAYLPDMWRMYQPFANADQETQQQAANLIQEQLVLLQRGVQRILDNTRSVSLGELKAHAVFLSQRVGQESQLTLTATAG